MTPHRSTLPPIPKERDYPDTSAGAMAYARDMSEWLRSYVETTDDHRKRSVETWTKQFGHMVVQHEADLQTSSSSRPGWIARDLANIAGELVDLDKQRIADNEAMMKQVRGARKLLIAAVVTGLSAIVSLLSTLAAQFILTGGAA